VAKWKDAAHILLRDKNAYDQMNRTSQAAMWIHEAVYRAMRDRAPMETSRAARRIVAYTFSTQGYDGVSNFSYETRQVTPVTKQTRYLFNPSISRIAYISVKADQVANGAGQCSATYFLMRIGCPHDSDMTDSQYMKECFLSGSQPQGTSLKVDLSQYEDTPVFLEVILGPKKHDTQGCKYNVTFEDFRHNPIGDPQNVVVKKAGGTEAALFVRSMNF